MPKLVAIELEKFQTINDRVVIPISELTLLFGPNGAGKSSIFDALEFLGKVSSYEWGERSSDIEKLMKRWARNNNSETKTLELGVGLKIQTPRHWQLSHIPEYLRFKKIWTTSLESDYAESLLDRTFSIYLKFNIESYGWKFSHIDIYSDRERIFELRQNDEEDFIRIYDLDWINLQNIEKTKNIKKENGYYECPTHWDDGPSSAHKWFRADAGFSDDRYLIEEMELIGQEIINFIRGILNTDIFNQSWPLVEGSRTVPSPNEVTTITSGQSYRNSDDKFFKGHTVEESVLLTILSKTLNTKPGWAHLCSEFSAHKSAPKSSNHFDELDTIQKINEILREELFEGSGYQLTGEIECLLTLEEAELGPDYYLPQYAKLVRLLLTDKLQNPVEIEDVGSGIGYVLPVLASLSSKGPSLIQQPELHLHPKLQSALGSAIVKCIENKEYFSAYTIIETHSEHILLRIMRMIKNAGVRRNEVISLLTFEKVSILFFEPTADGSTIIKRIRLNPLGELIDRWPGGFFNERFSDYFDE